jgi:hypothetical protein
MWFVQKVWYIWFALEVPVVGFTIVGFLSGGSCPAFA